MKPNRSAGRIAATPKTSAWESFGLDWNPETEAALFTALVWRKVVTAQQALRDIEMTPTQLRYLENTLPELKAMFQHFFALRRETAARLRCMIGEPDASAESSGRAA